LKRFGRNFLDFLKCQTANVRMRRELLAYGPQFPDRLDPSDFSFKALVNTNWPMVVEYELEQQGTAVLTIKVMGADTFTQTLTGEGMGKLRTTRFTLPVYEGPGPHPALITLKATRPGRFGDERAEFRLHGAGAGKEAVASLPRGPVDVEVAALGPLPHGAGRLAGEPPGRWFQSSLGLNDVRFGPGAGGYVFSFRVNGSFNRWGADITRMNVQKNNVESEERIVTAACKEEQIGPRYPVSGDWNGRDGSRIRVRPGEYTVLAMAWVSMTGDWDMEHAYSRSLAIK
jgi:hypothetical protein